ncbi:MAG: acyltransferase [Winogradskyella sp.]|nr:acyltransferase [Winogradskyella sp.]
MSSQSQRIFGLDVVRAIAILLVLISHSTILIFPESNSNAVFAIQFFGTIGVDIFFVLSGYLIGRILLKQLQTQDFSFKNVLYFWIRRWFRTLPNYYLILIVNIIIYFVFFNEFAPRLVHYFAFLQNFNQAQPDFFTESWTLSIEEFAYILGPLLLMNLFAITKKKITKYQFLGVVIVIILLSTLNRFWFHENAIEGMSWSNSLRKVVVYRIDSIYYGFIGAYLSLYAQHFWGAYKWTSFIFGALLFTVVHAVITIIGIRPSVESMFFNIMYLPLVSISILLTFPVFSNWVKKPSWSKIITNISQWSYALYLVNYSIILLSIQQIVKVEAQNIVAKLLLLVLFWALSFFMAFLLYVYYEKPMMDLRDRPFFRKWSQFTKNT